MKKTFKLILVVTVITILSLMATSAYAAQPENITWNYERDLYEDFTYGGKAVTEGTTEIINPTDKNFAYYDFYAKESGYYAVCTENDSWVIFAEEFDENTAKGIAEYEYFYIGYDEYRLFFLEKGENIMGISFYGLEEDTVTIEYYGSEILDYTINEEILDDYIIGWNVWECNPEYFSVNSDTVITFSSGKTLELEENSFEGTCDSTPVEGKSKATIEFFGIEKEVEFTAYYIDSIVESVELSNVEKHTTVYEDYTGENQYVEISGETLTVSFTDGTKCVAPVEENYATVVLPTGYQTEAYIGHDTYENILNVEFFGKRFIEINCEVEGMMLGDNLNVLRENNMESLRWSMRALEYAFENLGDNREMSGVFFRWSAEAFAQVFRNITSFVMYYLTFAR